MKIIATIFVCIIFIGCSDKKLENSIDKGSPMPGYSLFLADSTNYFNTANIQKGNPSVLFYFGPHCPYSRAEMGNIIDNMKKMKNIRFVLITTAQYSEMKDFYTHFSLYKYNNITTGIDYTNSFKNYFHIKGVPFLAIYGNDNTFKGSFLGIVGSNRIKEIAEE